MSNIEDSTTTIPSTIGDYRGDPPAYDAHHGDVTLQARAPARVYNDYVQLGEITVNLPSANSHCNAEVAPCSGQCHNPIYDTPRKVEPVDSDVNIVAPTSRDVTTEHALQIEGSEGDSSDEHFVDNIAYESHQDGGGY